MARNPFYGTIKPGDVTKGLMVQVGNSAFTTTLTTKTLVTRLKIIVAAHVTEGVSYANTDLTYADLATGVSTGLFSIKRAAGTTNGMTFSYTLIGY